MLNSRKKNCASRDKKNKYSITFVLSEIFFWNETKNQKNLQVKWSVPNIQCIYKYNIKHELFRDL